MKSIRFLVLSLVMVFASFSLASITTQAVSQEKTQTNYIGQVFHLGSTSTYELIDYSDGTATFEFTGCGWVAMSCGRISLYFVEQNGMDRVYYNKALGMTIVLGALSHIKYQNGSCDRLSIAYMF